LSSLSRFQTVHEEWLYICGKTGITLKTQRFEQDIVQFISFEH